MCLPGTVETVREGIEAERAAGHRYRVTRRATLAGAGAAALSALVPSPATADDDEDHEDRRRGRRQDLTHVFTAGFPVFTGDAPSRRTLTTIQANGFYSQAWAFGEHSGTHVDAPGHFVAGGRLVTALRPEELFAPAVVIDISARAATDPDAVVEVRDLRRFERRHGRIPRGAIVFMYSGWEERLPDPAAFKNPGPDGAFHFPGFGIDAVEWLLEHRRPTGIGVDTMSLDHGASTTFEVHRRVLGADRYGIENVANLSRIPALGAHVVVGVVPWEEGSGGPCRLLASY
jgi:kynurenine formamidase